MTADWFIDERRHAGEEHLDPERVARYDETLPFDPGDEVERALEHGLAPDDTVVDLGAGTGEFAIAVAPHCDRVVAVDVSEAMLAVARGKLADHGVDNVELVNAGIVRYAHAGEPAAYAFSRNALHHLPDFWKVEALRSIATVLEPGGILRLRDLVYAFDPWESHAEIERWLAEMADTALTEGELHAHFREEFSTYGFLLEAMLGRVGFELVDVSYTDGFYGAYTCRWPGDREAPDRVSGAH